MALTLLESAKRTENRLWAGIALSLVTTDELAAVLPFQHFAGQAITYLREGTLPQTEFIGDDGTMGSPSTGTDDKVSVPVRRIASDLDVDSLADDLSQGRDTGVQVAKKCKATWDLVKDRIVDGGNTTSHTLAVTGAPFTAITAMAYGPWLDSNRFGPGEIRYTHTGTLWEFRAPGDPAFGEPVEAATDGVYVLRSFNRSKYIVVTLDVSNATADGRTAIEFSSSNNEFDGLSRIVARDMVRPSVGANGDTFDFAILDELMDMEKVRTNRVFMMNGRLIRKFLAAQRLLGGTTPEHVRLPGYSGPTLAYRGVPIVQNDNIKSNEAKGNATTLSSIWLASLDAEEGLFMGVPSATGVEAQEIMHDPRQRPVMGFRIETIGALETKAHRRTRVQFYGALGLRSSKALARASEIITA